MNFIKLNNGWDADPNDPAPQVKIDNSNIVLKFYLNDMIHDDVGPDEIGVIVFTDCYMYRLGSTNDEGFYRGQCRFSKSGIKWGDFYNVLDEWSMDFPKDKVIVNVSLLNCETLKHYLFYFRDNTFECIAKDYCFEKKNGSIQS